MKLIERARELADAAGGGWLSAPDVRILMMESGLPVEQLLLDLIPLASSFALPPLSGFQVGAVAQGDTGAIYFGANVEFEGCALNQAVHAEQATVVNAAVHGETGLARLAVSAAPCGHCRQFLYELASARRLVVLLAGRPSRKVTDYLPDAFGPGDLGVAGGLLGPSRHRLEPISDTADPCAKAAFAAAVIAYAPYTQSFSGAGLVTRKGGVFSGPYLENAAFNPSVSPMQAAFISAVLGGASAQDITAAALVQFQDAKIDHARSARLVLEKIAPKITLHVETVVNLSSK